MIPLRDVIPSRTVPFVTVTLIVINAVVFLFEMSLTPRGLQNLVYHYGLVPVRFSFASAFTSTFLHAGWMHVIGNMWFLWIFGDNVEDRVGHLRFVAFYLLCGVFASLVQALSMPDSFTPTLGASGSIAGVMGAYFVLYPRSRVLTIIPPFIFWVLEIPAVFFLGYWFLLQILNVGMVADANVSGGVAFWAHIAGFVAGVLLVLVMKRPERQRVEWWDVE